MNVRLPRRALLALAGLIAVSTVLVLLAAAWVAALTVSRGELARADARLARDVRSAAAVISGRITAGDARAGSLATSRPLQRALLRRDGAAIRRLLRGRRDIAVYAGAKLLAGRPRFPSLTRDVSVVARGRTIGRVVASVPLDRPALERLAAEADVEPPERLVVRGRSRTGPIGRAFDLSTDKRYRAFAVQLIERPQPLLLEAQTPRSTIGDRAHRRTLWLVLATLASLATIVAAVWGARLLLRPRVSQLPRRRDVQQVLELVGDALASTHNPDKLLPVILHAAMEATGAVAGKAIRDGGVVAEEGTFDETGRPLQVELSSPAEADEELALLLYPPPTGFAERMIVLAETLGAQASVALENARLHRIVQRQAVTDELTGLANRRSFRESLEVELLRAERFGNPLSVIVADLDDFKLVNDRFGHQAGDEVLQAFGEVLRGRVRGVDLAARLGGEEFAVLLPETDAEGAEALAESLRAAIADLVVSVDSEQVRVTASFGVAAFPQTHTPDELLNAADLALYRAKSQGKDQVVSTAAREA
jgi:diguanylate cyclase (GGDEF)-like protein